MAENSMAKALARVQADTERTIENKRQAIESPAVSAFIKEGTAPVAACEEPPAPGPQRVEPTLIQLNSKIPEDLYRRARRAVFENQLGRLEPSSIQDLVAQALRAELRRLGY